MELANDQGTNFEKANWKFIEYYDLWMDLYKQPVVSMNTLQSYKASLAHFKKVLGGCQVGEPDAEPDSTVPE